MRPPRRPRESLVVSRLPRTRARPRQITWRSTVPRVPSAHPGPTARRTHQPGRPPRGTSAGLVTRQPVVRAPDPVAAVTPSSRVRPSMSSPWVSRRTGRGRSLGRAAAMLAEICLLGHQVRAPGFRRDEVPRDVRRSPKAVNWSRLFARTSRRFLPTFQMVRSGARSSRQSHSSCRVVPA